MVFVQNKQGEYQVLEVDTKSDSSLTLGDLFDDSFPSGSVVYPCEEVYVTEPPTQEVYPLNAGGLSARLLMKRQPALIGYGGTAFSTHSSYKVIAEVPLMQSGKANIGFERMFENWETPNNFFQDTATPYASVISQLKVLIKTPAQRQSWKKFFSDIAGGREPFWVPTWQSDLEVVSQPSSTTIKISEALDYKTTYYDTNALKNLMIVMTDGTIIYRSVTNCVVNGDDTQTLTLNSSYTGTVESVSFLVLSRLLGDKATLSHRPGYSELQFAVTSTRG
jgi:hypothetical protein